MPKGHVHGIREGIRDTIIGSTSPISKVFSSSSSLKYGGVLACVHCTGTCGTEPWDARCARASTCILQRLAYETSCPRLQDLTSTSREALSPNASYAALLHAHCHTIPIMPSPVMPCTIVSHPSCLVGIHPWLLCGREVPPKAVPQHACHCCMRTTGWGSPGTAEGR